MTSIAQISVNNALDSHGYPIQVMLIAEHSQSGQLLGELCRQVFTGVSVRWVYQLSEAIPMITSLAPDIVFVKPASVDDLLPADYITTIHSVAQDEHLPIIVLCDKQDSHSIEELSCSGATDSLAISDLSDASIYRCVRNAVEKSQLRRDNESKRVIIQQNNRELAIHKQHIGAFYETVSHELKSPLAGAREYVSLVLDGVCGDANSAQKELLTNAIQCCDTLRDLIHDLLDTAALENGMLTMRYQQCNLEELVRSTIARYSAVANRQGVSIQLNIQGASPVIDCDEFRISQLLSHLLSNAIKHSEASGGVQVTLSTSAKDFVSLSVKDSGPGIEPRHQQRIFDKFYQIKLEHEDEFEHHQGMGIGLFLCRSIACLHGGKLSLQSELGEGTVFTAQIPKMQQSKN